jgi:hypothetical protein
VGPAPTWDLPSIFSVAQAAGVSWGAFPDGSGYPTKFYASLGTPAATASIHPPSQFVPMAKAGTLPRICYVWSPSGYDEHPPAVNDPAYVTHGHDLVWQRVQAVIDGGGWANTTFILTWDDWGGYADSVPTPDIETAPDALHPEGFAAIGFFIVAAVGTGAVARGRARRHQQAERHDHEHGPGCGHPAVEHGDHLDYVHDGHRHAPHEGHYDEHDGHEHDAQDEGQEVVSR